MKKNKHTELTACIIALATALSCPCAQAEPPKLDWFSSAMPGQAGTKTPGTPSQVAKPQPSSGSQTPFSKQDTTASDADAALATKWFGTFDRLRAQYHPTPADKVILNRPLMQEEERVKQWTSTANKISHNYMLMAKALKDLSVPPQLSDLKEYRDLTADWYQDAAGVFDEMTRPRPAAKTIEELQKQLDQVKSRSEALVSTTTSLNAMEQSLRKRFKVGRSAENDELQQFIKAKSN